VSHLKRRMVHPDLFSDQDFQPPTKALLFVGMMSLAEDSGCLPWRADVLRGLTLPFSETSIEEVGQCMAELATAGRAWLYERGERQYAFLPDFPRWQAKLVRWSAPEGVPLPTGIVFTPFESKPRSGSGRYEWPDSAEALDPTALQALQENDGTALDLKEPAPLPAPLPANEGKPQGREREEQIKALEVLAASTFNDQDRDELGSLIERHGMFLIESAAIEAAKKARPVTAHDIADQLPMLVR
jgi:hypothetical protein